MWLLTTLITAVIVTLLTIFFKGKYKLGFLGLMLWGATFMILVDHVFGYQGGQFLESYTDGLVGNAMLLGLIMLIPVIAIWLVSVIIDFLQSGRSNKIVA
jgi:hypothetical protein